MSAQVVTMPDLDDRSALQALWKPIADGLMREFEIDPRAIDPRKQPIPTVIFRSVFYTIPAEAAAFILALEGLTIENWDDAALAPTHRLTTADDRESLIRLSGQLLGALEQGADTGALGDRYAELIEELRGGERISGPVLLLGKIALLTTQAEQIKRDMQQSVEAARSAGISWNDIGRAARITAQAAHRRWDPEARKRHTDYLRKHRSGGKNSGDDH